MILLFFVRIVLKWFCVPFFRGFFLANVLFLVFLSFLALALQGVHPNLLVILLKSSKIFASLRELSLLHALPDVPVNKGTLCVHQVELVVEPSPCLGNGRGVAEHAHSPGHLCQVPRGHHSWGLVVDSTFPC